MPPLYKNLFILNFEMGTYLDSKIYIYKKFLYTWKAVL